MPSIWFKKDLNLEMMKKFSKNTMVSHIGIELTKIGDDTLEGTMPVDERTFQPARLLHGGASCVLAETLGSVAPQYFTSIATYFYKIDGLDYTPHDGHILNSCSQSSYHLRAIKTI